MSQNLKYPEGPTFYLSEKDAGQKHQTNRNVSLMYNVYKNSQESLFGHFESSKYTLLFICKN